MVLTAAVVMQMCLGATYSWALFVGPLKQSLGIGQGTSQIPFTVFYIVFPATTLFAARVIDRAGLARSAAAGGLLFGCGWMLAGFGGSGIGWVILGVGVLGGLGVGLAYLAPIAAAIQWFPRRRGLVTGVAVAGFGAGAALVAQLAGVALEQPGANPFSVFRMFGLGFLLVVVLAATQMRLPPGAAVEKVSGWNLLDAFRKPGFGILYFAMFTGLAAGFTVNANLKQLSVGGAAAAGAQAVALFALANAAGRIVWGMLADRLSLRAGIRYNLLLQVGVVAMFPALDGMRLALPLLAVAAGFNYGGVLVLYAAAAARRWGSGQVAGAYGQLFSANIPAALAPVAAGAVFDISGSFDAFLIGLCALMIVAALGVESPDLQQDGS